MGRYKRKPYKKQSLDPVHKMDIEKEYLNSIQENDDNDLFDGLFSDELEEIELFDEPKIVQQLRREEREGKLPMWLLSYFEENDNDIKDDSLVTKMNTLPASDTRPNTSYEEVLELARKSFKNISTEKNRSISFDSDKT